MPVRYDEGEKFRWTHRCKEHPVDWQDGTFSTRYPLKLMQVADFFVITEEKRLHAVHNALYRWLRRRRAEILASGSDKLPPKFTVRPVEGLPDIYICRRVQ